jgi:hypothetical protein
MMDRCSQWCMQPKRANHQITLVTLLVTRTDDRVCLSQDPMYIKTHSVASSPAQMSLGDGTVTPGELHTSTDDRNSEVPAPG